MPNVLLLAGSSLSVRIKMVEQFIDAKVQRHRLLYSESVLASAFDDFGGMELKRIADKASAKYRNVSTLPQASAMWRNFNPVKEGETT